jgi:hypothetical protein
MIAIFAAIVEGNAAVVVWVGMGIAVLWMFYMMTFRTDDWLRLVKDEEERKAKRHERAGKILKGSLSVARWWMKK